MEQWFLEYVVGERFMPHGHCYLWSPAVLWPMVIADAGIALAYYSIPILLLVLYRRRRSSLPEPPLLWMFAAFIFLCGTTHLVNIWNVWNHAYWIEAGVKVMTAAMSVFTAWRLTPAIGRLVSLPTHAEMAAKNLALQREIETAEQTRSILSASEARYRQLVETAAEGIWIADTDGFTTFVNPRMAEMLGHASGELVGRSMLDFVPEEDRAWAINDLDRRRQGISDKHMSRFVRHDGQIINALISASPVREGDAIVGILAVVTDLTEQVRAEQELRRLTSELEGRVAERTAALEAANTELKREVEERRETANRLAEREAHLSAVLDSTVDAIVVINERGIIESVNPATCSMFGYAEDQLLGRNVAILAEGTDREVHDQYLARYLRTREPRVIGIGREVVGRKRGGERLTLSLSVSETFVNGQRRFVGILHDISQLRRDADNIRVLNTSLQESNERLKAEVAIRELGQQELQQLNARMEIALDAMRDQTEHYRMLQEMSEMLQTCKDEGEAAAIIGQFARRLFAADSGTVYLCDNDEARLDAAFVWGERDESQLAMRNDACWAVRHGRPYPLSDLQHDVVCSHLTLHAGRHALCLPLYALGTHLGLVSLRRSTPFVEGGNPYESDSFQLKLGFLHHAALAIASIASTRRLEQQSTRDALTGLFNRRYMIEHIGLEIARAKRGGTALAALMIDIDHFKGINDTLGHAAGDQALIAVAHLLANNARASDVVCRWGGEEFVMLMPGADCTAALERAEQIRQAVFDMVIPLVHKLPKRLSVSIGVSCMGPAVADVDALTNAADHALYDAKEGGRNRCVVAGMQQEQQ